MSGIGDRSIRGHSDPRAAREPTVIGPITLPRPCIRVQRREDFPETLSPRLRVDAPPVASMVPRADRDPMSLVVTSDPQPVGDVIPLHLEEVVPPDQPARRVATLIGRDVVSEDARLDRDAAAVALEYDPAQLRPAIDSGGDQAHVEPSAPL